MEISRRLHSNEDPGDIQKRSLWASNSFNHLALCALYYAFLGLADFFFKERRLAFILASISPIAGVLYAAFDFISLAEEIGLINQIGFQVLDIATQDVRHWQRRYQPELTLAVNFSGCQLQSPDIGHDLIKVLMRNDFSPSYLDIEITESILIRDFKQVLTKLHALQRLGCRVAMDDFGTGYSSLNYARMIPWDILKIDRSFVSDIHLNQVNSTIVKNVILAANDLGFEIIAEGVETEEELAILKEYQCNQAQGYLFAKPMPFGAITEQFFNASLISTN